MSFALKPIALAILVTTAQLSGAAYAQTQTMPVEPLVKPVTTATKAPIEINAPQDWIMYDDTTYTPVVDDVSRHLAAARKAFDAKDNKKAATEMRAVADQLKLQTAMADKENLALEKADKALMVTDTKLAHDSIKRMNASALKVSSAADAIESGKIKTTADFDKVIDKAARADMDRRWLVADVTTWYPVNEEPQRHFTDAVAAYAKKDYKAAAADIRKATGYLRLEAGRATGETKQKLDSSVAELDTLAASVEKGLVQDKQSMAIAFAHGNRALALAHRSKAAESWARKEYVNAGYELKAAAHGLESAAGWVGEEAKAGASATVADTQALGGKLASGATWTRDEVEKGFKSLDNGIHALGQKIGVAK